MILASEPQAQSMSHARPRHLRPNRPFRHVIVIDNDTSGPLDHSSAPQFRHCAPVDTLKRMQPLKLFNCRSITDAYISCVRKHPVEKGVVCKGLGELAGWCALHEVCPSEGAFSSPQGQSCHIN